MRGKEKEEEPPEEEPRITPAYAGKSDISSNANSPEKDHPRLCGEKRRTG